MMHWAFLLLSGLFEIVGVAGFERQTRGPRRGGLPLALFGFGGAVVCLKLAVAVVPLSVAYAVFTGIGTVGSATMGIAFWGESARWPRLACMALVVLAVIGLKVTH